MRRTKHTDLDRRFTVVFKMTLHHNEIPPNTGQNGHHKQINKQVLVRLWRKRNPSTLLRMQTGVALWKTVWNFLKKLKMKLPLDLAIPLLGLYPKNPKTPIRKNLCIPMFIAA